MWSSPISVDSSVAGGRVYICGALSVRKVQYFKKSKYYVRKTRGQLRPKESNYNKTYLYFILSVPAKTDQLKQRRLQIYYLCIDLRQSANKIPKYL